MLSATRPTARCIYCAFRSHQLALQARRLKSTNTEPHKRTASESSRPLKIRYQDNHPRHRSSPAAAYAGGEGIVRKFFSRRLEGDGSGGNEIVQDRKLDFGEVLRDRLSKKQDFGEVLRDRLSKIKDELKDAPLLEQLQKESQGDGGRTQSFSRIWQAFARKLGAGGTRSEPFFGGEPDGNDKTTLQDLRQSYRERGINGLDDRIKYAFYGHVTGARFTESDIKNQKALADLRYPTEWFPATRSDHRTIHLHVGPTNSGKTYHALQRLEQAEKGVYAGPLRLLAHEVYSRLKAKGKNCALVTGEERRAAEDSDGRSIGDLVACTVEMMPLNEKLDVAVIDEIQMIGNGERGWAWTQALLGVRAREVHLCGEERTVPLIRELCASVGEKLEIHKYERLSPLKVADESLGGDLKKLRKGDCIVSFSVMGIHALRRQIERATGKKVATVYGSLPPETRAQQARLFNDPNNDYDYLVASDAVGMGLNLAIKRMIFEAANKFDGVQRRTLSVADIKQIGGRAGRYRTAAQDTDNAAADQDLAAAKGDSPATPAVPVTRPTPLTGEANTGIVTTLEKFDFPVVRAAMVSEPEPIRTAGLFPPAPVLERFASYFPPGTPFSYILTRLHELSMMHSRFHLCGLRDQVWVADLIEPVKGLTVNDRNSICSCPASKGDMDLWRQLMPAYARIIAEQTGGNILDIEELPLEVLEAEVSPSREYLRELERLHKGIVGYLWLSYRFAGIFGTRALAFHVKGLVEDKIETVLGSFSFSETDRRKIAAKREKAVLNEMQEVVLDEEGSPREDAVTGEDIRSASVEEEDDQEEIDQDDEEEDDEKVSLQTDRQTSLTAGGDRFGGDEDIVFEEPEEVDTAEEEQGQPSSSFVKWRGSQTKSQSQAPLEHDIDSIIADATAEGENAGLVATQYSSVEDSIGNRPSVQDIVPAAAVEHSGSDGALSPEQDTVDLAAPVTPATELEDDQPPIETQQVPPAPEEGRTATERPAGENQFGGIPPKHLAHLDVSVTEPERNVASRP